VSTGVAVRSSSIGFFPVVARGDRAAPSALGKLNNSSGGSDALFWIAAGALRLRGACSRAKPRMVTTTLRPGWGVAVASGRPGAYPCGHSPVVLLKNYAIRTKYADAKAVAISALTNTWDERNFVASSPASMKALLAGPHIFSVVQRADHT